MKTRNSKSLLDCRSGYEAVTSAHEETGIFKKARNRAWANSQKSPAVEYEEKFSTPKPKRVRKKKVVVTLDL